MSISSAYELYVYEHAFSALTADFVAYFWLARTQDTTSGAQDTQARTWDTTAGW